MASSVAKILLQVIDHGYDVNFSYENKYLNASNKENIEEIELDKIQDKFVNIICDPCPSMARINDSQWVGRVVFSLLKRHEFSNIHCRILNGIKLDINEDFAASRLKEKIFTLQYDITIRQSVFAPYI